MKALHSMMIVAVLTLGVAAIPSSTFATNGKTNKNDKKWEKSYSHKPCPSEVRSLLTSIGDYSGIHVNFLRAIGLLNKECGKIVNAPATTTTDTTAPTFTNIFSNVATSSVTITWATNENTKAKIYYSTTTPVVIADSTKFKTYNDFDVDHTYKFRDLKPLTTYFYKIVATDRSGNSVTSNEYSFVTKTSDINSPMIKSVSLTAVASTSAKISWATSEPTFGRVIYSTSPNVTSGTGTVVASSTKSTNHKITLAGLTPSTIYYYVIGSTDSSGNNATSSLFAFMTQP